MRPEIRIITMTKDEYKKAVRKFTQSEEEAKEYFKSTYYMYDFSGAFDAGMKIAACCDTHTQYFAVLTKDNKPWNHDGILYELPESFKM